MREKSRGNRFPGSSYRESTVHLNSGNIRTTGKKLKLDSQWKCWKKNTHAHYPASVIYLTLQVVLRKKNWTLFEASYMRKGSWKLTARIVFKTASIPYYRKLTLHEIEIRVNASRVNFCNLRKRIEHIISVEIRQQQWNCKEPSKWLDFYLRLTPLIYIYMLWERTTNKASILDYTSIFFTVVSTSFVSLWTSR